MSLRSLFRAERRALYAMAFRHGLFGLIPILVTGVVLYLLSRVHYLAYDFHHSYWAAGDRLMHGVSLYGGNADVPASISGSVRNSLTVDRTLFVYPAPAAFLFVPFALLSRAAGDWLFTGLCIASVLVALRVLRVRDWRVYGVVMLWAPVVSGYQNANLSLLIVLGLALAWRYRDHSVAAGLIVAVLLSAKMFVWPLCLWLLATRRYVAFVYAAIATVAINLVAWSIAGFDQVSRYLILLRTLTRFEERRGFSVLSLVLHLGVSRTAAYVVASMVAGIAAAISIVLGRRGDDRTAFAWAIAVTLLATPVIWSHYYALLIVPLAVARPRLSPIWLLALLMWIPVENEAWTQGSWQLVFGLCLTAAIFATAVSRRPIVPHAGRRRTTRGSWSVTRASEPPLL
jgi:hypothetical protein